MQLSNKKTPTACRVCSKGESIQEEMRIYNLLFFEKHEFREQFFFFGNIHPIQSSVTDL